MPVTEQILRNLFLSFIRLHILHFAVYDRIFGVQIIHELTRHGYPIGPGTLYPILHELEKNGLLLSSEETVDGKRRKYYTTTVAGAAFLDEARQKAVELVKDIAG
jgi:PadR family transcriptional regulator, regulatory protein PadR